MARQSGERRSRNADIRMAAAQRRIGHDHAYAIVMAPHIARGFALLAVAAAGWWVWTHVSHTTIAEVVAGAGALLLIGYAAHLVSTGGSIHARMMARASGQHVSALFWHAIGGAGTALVAAGLLIWQGQ